MLAEPVRRAVNMDSEQAVEHENYFIIARGPRDMRGDKAGKSGAKLPARLRSADNADGAMLAMFEARGEGDGIKGNPARRTFAHRSIRASAAIAVNLVAPPSSASGGATR